MDIARTSLIGAGVGAALGVVLRKVGTGGKGAAHSKRSWQTKIPGLLTIPESEETLTTLDTLYTLAGRYCAEQFEELVREVDRHASLERLCRDFPERVRVSYGFQSQRYSLTIRNLLDRMCAGAQVEGVAKEELEHERERLIDEVLKRHENIQSDVALMDVSHVQRDLRSKAGAPPPSGEEIRRPSHAFPKHDSDRP